MAIRTILTREQRHPNEKETTTMKIHLERSEGSPPARTAHDRTETVCGLIEGRARAHPERAAIVDGETEIDYGRLMERASAIAAELADRGVPPGSLVGVCMHRTWELVATLVGVLRAGCAYVPLDPAYPRDRVRYMLEHSRAVGAVVDHEQAAELCKGVPELVRIDDVKERTADDAPGPSASDSTRPSASDLAYVIYTSGSTGRP
jgi:non-ribosomal peptide synthetase component F